MDGWHFVGDTELELAGGRKRLMSLWKIWACPASGVGGTG